MNRFRLLLLIFIVCIVTSAVSYGLSWYRLKELRPATAFVPDRPIIINNSQSLKTLFDALAYPWPLQPLARIPPVEIAVLPGDLSELKSHRERKALFLRILLPMVLMRNEQLRQQRITVQSLYQTLQTGRVAETPSELVSRSLDSLFKEYQIDANSPLGVRLNELLLRLDEIPPSLVLAQAAVESNWGRSKAAQQGNNLFNGWLAEPKGDAFHRLSESVNGYMHYLNTAVVFAEFRQARQIIRIEGRDFESHTLAGLITKQVKKKQTYTGKLRRVIHGSELRRLDKLQLRSRDTATQAD